MVDKERKTVLAVFAHPDDESFGPGGTLALLAQTYDVHILYITKGQAGEVEGCESKRQTADIRKKEAEEACKILGIKNVSFLRFHDGLLCNNHYHQMAEYIQKTIDIHHPEILITFEPRGFTGHLDHVLVSTVTTYIYQKNKDIKSLWYFCIDTKQRKALPEYYIMIPPGYKHEEISKKVDISSVWNKKLDAMKAHQSQKKDFELYKPMLETSNKREFFLILEK